MDDSTIVGKCQNGQAEFYGRLVDKYSARIINLGYAMMGNRHDAEDVAQEAFVRAYKGLARFQKKAKFSSWLYQIALNLCRDRLRQRRGKTLVSIDDLDPTTAARIDRSPATAQDIVEAKDLGRIVALAMADLPEEQREVITLKEYQGLTFQEIADTLGVPVSTVKTRLYRGLVQMRERLERQGVGRPAPAPAPSS